MAKPRKKLFGRAKVREIGSIVIRDAPGSCPNPDKLLQQPVSFYSEVGSKFYGNVRVVIVVITAVYVGSSVHWTGNAKTSASTKSAIWLFFGYALSASNVVRRSIQAPVKNFNNGIYRYY